jgi:aminoglycoside phosphotransferase
MMIHIEGEVNDVYVEIDIVKKVAKKRVKSIYLEVEAIKYIRQHTNVPVPEIIEYNTECDNPWFTMKFIEGRRLYDIWDKMNKQQKAEILESLSTHIKTIATTYLPFVGKPGYLVANTYVDYLSLMIDAIEIKLPEIHDLKDTILDKMKHIDNGKYVYVHEDLEKYNLIVLNKRIVGIIDWEQCSVLPSYFALNTPSWLNDYDLYPEDSKYSIMYTCFKSLDIDYVTIHNCLNRAYYHKAFRHIINSIKCALNRLSLI